MESLMLKKLGTATNGGSLGGGYGVAETYEIRNVWRELRVLGLIMKCGGK